MQLKRLERLITIDLLLVIRKSLLWGCFCVVLVLILFIDSAIPCYYSGSDYFNPMPGYGIRKTRGSRFRTNGDRSRRPTAPPREDRHVTRDSR